jgi:hypothetical protein
VRSLLLKCKMLLDGHLNPNRKWQSAMARHFTSARYGDRVMSSSYTPMILFLWTNWLECALYRACFSGLIRPRKCADHNVTHHPTVQIGIRHGRTYRPCCPGGCPGFTSARLLRRSMTTARRANRSGALPRLGQRFLPCWASRLNITR